MAKTKLFSVGIHDCRVDTFTVGGNGGGGKDTSNTGVRISHLPSSATGRATDTRSQAKNKSLAFRRMGESAAFQAWAKRIAAEFSTGKSLEQRVEEDMIPQKIRIEVYKDGKWQIDT